MDLKKTLRDIKNLKIQSAENISTAAILVLQSQIKKSKAKTRTRLISEAEIIRQSLMKTRPTEPEMENYLNYIIKELVKIEEDDPTKIKKIIHNRIKLILKNKRIAKLKIISNAQEVIKPNSRIFTHCHSTTVVDTIKRARSKKIKVSNTETRPLFQGRITAKELSNAGIKVKHYNDSGARIALKESDIMLIGADSITYNKVYNKIGSEMFALVAKDLKVPVYICASLWKFTPHKEDLEKRHTFEIWKNHPKKIKVQNYSFEKISFKLIKGIICEEGILKPKVFVKRARKLIK
jgi:ribose 1,5-bisphosphate isomerase